MVKVIIKGTRVLANKMMNWIELNRYDNFSIAEYFRKQGAIIGEHNRIIVRTLGDEPYLIKIGNHCTIAPNVTFLCHDGATWLFTDEYPSMQKFGFIEIKDNCFIGHGSIILGNVCIGPNAIVGAGAVVTKNVSEGVIVGGNPAKIISTVDKFKEKAVSLWERQRPTGYFEELENGKAYPPAYIRRMKDKDANILREHLIKLYSEEKHS